MSLTNTNHLLTSSTGITSRTWVPASISSICLLELSNVSAHEQVMSCWFNDTNNIVFTSWLCHLLITLTCTNLSVLFRDPNPTVPLCRYSKTRHMFFLVSLSLPYHIYIYIDRYLYILHILRFSFYWFFSHLSWHPAKKHHSRIPVLRLDLRQHLWRNLRPEHLNDEWYMFTFVHPRNLTYPRHPNTSLEAVLGRFWGPNYPSQEVFGKNLPFLKGVTFSKPSFWVCSR